MSHLGTSASAQFYQNINLIDKLYYHNISERNCQSEICHFQKNFYKFFLFSLSALLTRPLYVKIEKNEEIYMNIWHDISKERITSEDFMCYIEISKGSKSKYELDKETGVLRLDRVLYTSTVYPASYGFIPRTLADDDDPLDVLVLCSEPILPASLVQCYPIGVINMIDDGKMDEKIISIPFREPTYNIYQDISQLPAHIFDEMMHFFEVYKVLEHKTTSVKEIMGKESAIAIVKKSIENYEKAFSSK